MASAKRKRRIVAMAGKSPTTREMINLEPEDSVEVWGLTDAYLHITRRVDRWFEMHTKDADGLYRGFADWMDGYDRTYRNWLWDADFPVYMNALDEDIPSCVVFPFHEVGKKYRSYFTSTVAYMLALAALERVDELHLWGIDMAGGSEWEHQRPCCEYWMGVLDAQGCEIKIPESSPLLKSVMGTYGIVLRKLIDPSTVMDAISQTDNLIVNGKKEDIPENRGRRKGLIQLLNDCHPETKGKIIEPQLTIIGSDLEDMEAHKQRAREAVLGDILRKAEAKA